MRILIAYPGPTHSTFDVARGYEKALCQLGHEVYGYPYHQWLQFYDAALTHWETINDRYTYDLNDVSLHASQHLVTAAIEFGPDAVLIVSGTALHSHAYGLLHALDIPITLLLTESPYEDEVQALFVDGGKPEHTFTNERLSVDRLSQNGASVSYLPHSFDADVHRPTMATVATMYRSDVFFHGTMWPERVALVEALTSPGMGIEIRFSGVDVEQPRGTALVDNHNLVYFYRGAAICLNHHRTMRGEAGQHIEAHEAESIGPRAYEIAACGAFQLCDDTRPELWEIFGHGVPTYHDADDLRARIEYFMSRPDERRELANLARERVQGCTFVHRAQEFVEPVLRGL